MSELLQIPGQAPVVFEGRNFTELSEQQKFKREIHAALFEQPLETVIKGIAVMDDPWEEKTWLDLHLDQKRALVGPAIAATTIIRDSLKSHGVPQVEGVIGFRWEQWQHNIEVKGAVELRSPLAVVPVPQWCFELHSENGRSYAITYDSFPDEKRRTGLEFYIGTEAQHVGPAQALALEAVVEFYRAPTLFTRNHQFFDYNAEI